MVSNSLKDGALFEDLKGIDRNSEDKIKGQLDSVPFSDDFDVGDVDRAMTNDSHVHGINLLLSFPFL